MFYNRVMIGWGSPQVIKGPCSGVAYSFPAKVIKSDRSLRDAWFSMEPTNSIQRAVDIRHGPSFWLEHVGTNWEPSFTYRLKSTEARFQRKQQEVSTNGSTARAASTTFGPFFCRQEFHSKERSMLWRW